MGASQTICPLSRFDDEESKLGVGPPFLVVLTFNIQQYKSFPSDSVAGARRLREIISIGDPPPDVLCIQEAVEDEFDHLGSLGPAFGFQKVQSSSWLRLPLNPSSLITNQLYVRSDSAWEVIDAQAELISSKMVLTNKDYCATPFYMPVRTCVWAKLKPKNRTADDGPSIIVFTAHLTGGRYEDQCFLQRLSQERSKQIARIIATFEKTAQPLDVGIFAGDFNASAADARTDHYFDKMLWNTVTVQNDAKKLCLDKSATLAEFAEYMNSPFNALAQKNWKLAYDEAIVGPTSTYGSLVDFVSVSDLGRFPVMNAVRIPACARNDAGGKKHTSISDHDAVRTTFDTSHVFLKNCWYAGGTHQIPSVDEVIDCWAARLNNRRRTVTTKNSQATDNADMTCSVGESPFKVLIRQCEGHSEVRIYAKPEENAEVIGTVPSGSISRCLETTYDFVRVSVGNLDGWVGAKNTKMAPIAISTSVTDTKGSSQHLLLRQADGHSSVRVFAEPRPGSEVVAEIQSGTTAPCSEFHGDFARVKWKNVEGWVGIRNTCSIDDASHY